LLALQNEKVAVLAIDPSSFLTGGSILGDQTRMLDLFRQPNAYIRPSPNRLSLGGISDTTTEVVKLCEAAGYNIIFVETVGVGQAEIEVAQCVDMFVLLVTPTSGDDLQGLKRGIMEMTDLVVVNKCEGDLQTSAKHAKSDFQRALRLSHSRRGEIWSPNVLLCSCIDYNDGSKNEHTVDKVWKEIEKFFNAMKENDEIVKQRREQYSHAVWKYVWRYLRTHIENMKPQVKNIEENAMNEQISLREGCNQILQQIFKINPFSKSK